MKNKFRQIDVDNYETDEHEDDQGFRQNKRKQQERRRPVRNWKREWINKADRYDEVDDFYGK